MFIDTHAHLDMHEFDGDREDMLRRAVQGAVTRIISIGTDLPSSCKALELSKRYDYVFCTVGYHPHHAKDLDRHTLEELVKLAREPWVVGWGEIGLDFFRDHSPRQKQLAAFEEQLDVAAQMDLPVIIHDREAHKEIMGILKRKQGVSRRGVFHCFSGDERMAMALVDMGFYISIPGTVTYKNASVVQGVATKVPLEYLLIETDAPYLSPAPHRGKRNEPLFVTHTARKIAELRGMDLRELALITWENAARLFRLGPTP